jgi:spore coat protein U-like protein
MKTFVSATAFAAFVAIAAGSAMADSSKSSTGDVRLTGTMPAICEIDVDTKNTAIDMQEGAKKQVVAEITETCNDHEGYTISFTSENEGKIVHGESGQGIGYTVSYDSASNSALDKSLIVNRAKEGYGVEHDLIVDMSGSNDRVAGTYRDTITIQIAAK